MTRFHLSCKRRSRIYLKTLAYFVQKLTNISLQFLPARVTRDAQVLSFYRLQNQLEQCNNKYLSSIFFALLVSLLVLTPRKCCHALFAVSFRCHRKSNYPCFENTVKGKFQMEFRPMPSCFFFFFVASV